MLNLSERRRILSPSRLVLLSVSLWGAGFLAALAFTAGFSPLARIGAVAATLAAGAFATLFLVVPVAVIHQTKHEKKSGVFSHLGMATVHELGDRA